MCHVLKSDATLLLSFGGSMKPQMAAVGLLSLPKSFCITLVEGKFMKRMNKGCYIAAILMVRVFLGDKIKQVGTFPK